MGVYKLPNVITKDDLIPFDLFPVADPIAAREIVNIRYLEASTKLINFLLRNIRWKGYQYTNSIDNTTKIGYNLTVGINSDGLTEDAAYTLWITDFKEVERKFKKLFILDSLTQSQYDGLLSMYYLTGEWAKVGTDERKFNLVDDIKNRRWEYVATAMSHSGVNRITRQDEAKIIMLAEYGIELDRISIKEQSLQDIVKRYPSRLPNDTAREQAEYVYYAETGRFLPNMSESRKRILVRQLNR